MHNLMLVHVFHCQKYLVHDFSAQLEKGKLSTIPVDAFT